MGDASPRNRTLKVRGLRFHYVEWGEPSLPSMVLLHGLNSHCRLWDTFARSLSECYHIFALDQRGHGDTQWPTAPTYATGDYVGDLTALLDAWGVGRAVLIGLSMGGHNAIAYAAKHPQMVSHLIVVDMAPYRDWEIDPEMKALQERVAREGHPQFDGPDFAFQQFRAANTIASDEALRHRAVHAVKRLPNGKYTFKHDPRVGLYWRLSDLWPLLPSVKTPTLLVRGGQSQILSSEVARRMLDAFPNVRMVTVGEAGHTVPEDCPQQFEQAVRSFLGC